MTLLKGIKFVLKTSDTHDANYNACSLWEFALLQLIFIFMQMFTYSISNENDHCVFNLGLKSLFKCV